MRRKTRPTRALATVLVSSTPEAKRRWLGPTVRETVILDGRSFVILHPTESDRLLAHPDIAKAFAPPRAR